MMAKQTVYPRGVLLNLSARAHCPDTISGVLLHPTDARHRRTGTVYIHINQVTNIFMLCLNNAINYMHHDEVLNYCYDASLIYSHRHKVSQKFT